MMGELNDSEYYRQGELCYAHDETQSGGDNHASL